MNVRFADQSSCANLIDNQGRERKCGLRRHDCLHKNYQVSAKQGQLQTPCSEFA
jgi:hypothetical protein